MKRHKSTHSQSLKPRGATALAALVGAALCAYAPLAQAQSYSISLDVLNAPDGDGEIVVAPGADVVVDFAVEDPAAELSKHDTIELVLLDTDEVVASRKRGKSEAGTVDLTVAADHSGYAVVRYRQGDDVLQLASGAPLLLLPDASQSVLLDRIKALEGDMAALEARVAAAESAHTSHAADPHAHHTPYTDIELEQYLSATGIDWALVRNVPADLADGDQDTQLTEAAVDAFCSDNGYLTSVAWTDIAGIPADIADGDQDTQLSEAQVDAYAGNNGFLTDIRWEDIVPTSLERLDDVLSVAGTDVIFSGVNVHVRSGTGRTDDYGILTGRGNLIVGYDEAVSGSEKTGSHTLVVGAEHSYTGFGGLVAGMRNRVSGRATSVCGGYGGEASGQYATVSGGLSNVASGSSSTAHGGHLNRAEGAYTTAGGGRENVAVASRSSVSGGFRNRTEGQYATVSAGASNVASGAFSSVSGGGSNTASGIRATVGGGNGNHASAQNSFLP